MKKILFSFLIGIMISSIALGGITNPNRPWGTAASLSELADLMNNLPADTPPGIGSTIDVVADQSGVAIFEPTGFGNAAAGYLATISWLYPGIEFGIYEYGDTSNRVMLFNAATSSVGDVVNFDFDSVAGTVTSYKLGSGTIDQSTNYFRDFGFYVEATDHSGGLIGPYYSEDNLNQYGDAHFLAYEAKGENVTIPVRGMFNDVGHWYIAAESDIAINRTAFADFTDFVVQVESIQPVPVPAAILLGILGMSVAGLKLRKYA